MRMPIPLWGARRSIKNDPIGSFSSGGEGGRGPSSYNLIPLPAVASKQENLSIIRRKLDEGELSPAE